MYIPCYGGHSTKIITVLVHLEISCLPYKQHNVYVSPILENILGVDIHHELQLHITMGAFHLHVCIVKMIRRHVRNPPLTLLVPLRVMIMEQYCLPGGHDEINSTTEELEKVRIIQLVHSPYNLLVWLMVPGG